MLFIQNIAEKEIINAEMTFMSKLKPSLKTKTETRIYHRCTRVSHKRVALLESHAKWLQVKLLKDMSQDFIALFPIPLHLMFLNESVLCDWFSLLNYT